MILIKILELRTERVIRAILRDVMRNVATIEDYGHAVGRIKSIGWGRMHDSIVANYNNGYIAGGNLIRRHMPHIRTAALPIEHEDPRIARHTTRLIYGLEQVADGQRNEIQAALRTQYEKGATSTQIRDRMEWFFDDDRTAASRFARTATNDIYNRAHIDRYENSGVVDGIQLSAHIDTRTSKTCIMLDDTIYALDDPNMRVPPFHFNCLVAGTRIITANGHKNIEHVEVGDLVLTKLYRYMPVTATMVRNANDIIELETYHRQIRITSNHPVFAGQLNIVTDEYLYDWVDAGEIRAGDTVICLNDVGEVANEETILSTRNRHWEPELVYNLSVLCDESYYANGILVHNCRTRSIPWFGRIPGRRDFVKEFGSDYVGGVENQMTVFRSKYWVPMPRTRASAAFQRRFFDKRDILDVSHSLNLMKRRVRTQELKIKSLRSQMTKGLTKHELAINRSLAREIYETQAKILSKYKVTSSTELAMLIKRLKNVTDPTTIVETYGKSLMLDKIERRLIKDAIRIEISAKTKAGKIIRADALKKVLEMT